MPKKGANISLSSYLQYPGEDMILQDMYRLVMKLIADRCRSERTDPVVSELAERIASSYNDPEFRIAEALAATGYNPDHIRRRFLRVIGMTPAEYLKQVRMRYAKSLLHQKKRLHLSIGEIALMCGYYDAAYFCRIFTAQTGMNPSSYVSETQ